MTSVLLTDDLVEHLRDFYEVYRNLERGFRRLCQAGITVFGIAGAGD